METAAHRIVLPSGGRQADRMHIIRAPFTRQAMGELAYALVGLPLALIGFALTLVALVAGTALSVTFIGLPLLALGVMAARASGAIDRGLANALLGTRLRPPPRFEPRAGFFGWLGDALRDGPGWRAVLYRVIRLPLAVFTAAVAVFVWGYAVALVTLPVWAALFTEGLPVFDLPAEVAFDGWAVVRWLIGVALLLAAPWLVRGPLVLDRLLMTALLTSPPLADRVRDLERTRASAVEDSAARLRRIERDLHDGAQAQLVALAMKLGIAKESIDSGDTETLRALVTSAHTTAKDALVELRDLARGIHPPALDSGLAPALTTLTARSALPVDLTVDIGDRPSPAIESIAYFCAAELLTNAAKHSGATRAEVSVHAGDDGLRLLVRDNGSGGAAIGAGTGLAGLAERVRTVDGRLAIASPVGGPTEIRVDLPRTSA
ncbi:sensor histidine kinase [Actinokineospora iranica]|uniref:histidine kinase n=1 Tax=Actinokineospora iranica TaxID=1271860 RepID=A0A1G6LTS5_9PSEU|nr:sensor histidine kinase [Actinokineospora iranica]SDC46497.1 Signal transduction histidine kinase [Actinokineospora iranica]